MEVIDFHSHILPGIDDGSQNIKTSLQMLKESTLQGVDIMMATPHFYASKDRIEDFLKRRNRAYDSLRSALGDHLQPRLRLGAEVAFFPGISGAAKIDSLTFQGTRLLLLEMPFRSWTTSDIREVEKMIEKRGFQIILAHLERYMGMKENKKKIQELKQMPLYVQINAGSLLDWKKRRSLLKMFQNGEAHLLGSDCHGIDYRAPNLAKGREMLNKKIGKDALQRIDILGNKLIMEKKVDKKLSTSLSKEEAGGIGGKNV